VFDPAELVHRVRAPGDWWRNGDLPELLEGRALIASLGREGEVSLHLDFDPPSEAVRRFLRGSLYNLHLQVSSGRIFVGPGERLPGDGAGERLVALPGQGCLIQIPNGHYKVTIHALDWHFEDAFFGPDDEVLADAPPDFWLTLEPGGEPGANVFSVPLQKLLNRPEVSLAKERNPGGPIARSIPAPPPGARHRAAAPTLCQTAPKTGLHRALGEALGWRTRIKLEPSQDIQIATAQPLDRFLEAQEWTTAELLKKLTRVRENMRVLEQKVNRAGSLELSNQVLLDADITGVYEACADLGWLLSGQEESP